MNTMEPIDTAFGENLRVLLEQMVVELRDLLKRTRSFVEMAMPDLGDEHHCGGPDSCCDCDCMVAAELGEMLRDIDKAVEKAGKVGE